VEKDYLILKQAAVSRPSGQWNDDDYDVVANGEVVASLAKREEAGECLIWRLPLGRGSILCAPILHALGSDGFVRANNAIDGMAFKQLRTGIF
jgi:hypothetical protein